MTCIGIPFVSFSDFGRIDRIGSTHDKVYGLNFLPELGIEQNLGLRQRLERRIAEIQETIGEDSAILDPAERVNEEAMYAIYDNQPSNLDLFEPDEPMGFGGSRRYFAANTSPKIPLSLNVSQLSVTASALEV